MTELKTPWINHYGDVKFHLDYPDCTMSDAVLSMAEKTPDQNALEYMGRNIKFRHLSEMIDKCAKSFYALGIRKDDIVTICMPNMPQSIFCLYALNKIGAVASMIHPLSAEGEIINYLDVVNSDYCLTLDQFYPKFLNVIEKHPLKKLIITSAVDEALTAIKLAFPLTEQGRKIEKVKDSDTVITWKSFLKLGVGITDEGFHHQSKDDCAVILFSGGTTGTTKGIMLSNLNFNALGLQTAEMSHRDIKGKKMLAAMPIFHGFGLGVCIHTVLEMGAEAILVPTFNVKSYSKLIKKKKPNFIAGVPTLYEAITRTDYLDGVDLSFLLGVFSGGDSLPIELKRRFDKFLDDHNSPVHVREGYGTTECVTASCLTPYCEEREGSIGLPFPDTYYIICKPGTIEEVPYGEEGEICLCGPSVMIGYLNNEEETKSTLREHEDGHIWLHTGDLGYMDEDGFIYFKQRIKRMIITSGYNVYPSQLENIIDAHPAVQMSCVIGVKDDYKMQRVKAYIVLKNGVELTDEVKESMMDHCKKNIAKYALPKEIEYRDSLPKTLVGKIAYTVLEKEANGE